MKIVQPPSAGVLRLLAIAQFTVLTACVPQRHMVIASTGTNIGLELSQNTASGMPQGKLGYNRAELAIVPTNRDAGEPSGSTGNGASDIPDVVMELKFTGIFSTNAGIYQRLAVGANAVKSNGAEMMFARDAQGQLDEKAVQAVEALHPSKAEDVTRASDLRKKYLACVSTPVEQMKFDIAVKQIAGFEGRTFQDFIGSTPNATELDAFSKALDKQSLACN